MLDPRVEKAMHRGLTAFNTPFVTADQFAGSQGVQSGVLMNVDIGDKNIAQRWLINMNAYRYRSGQLSTTDPDSVAQLGPPSADNQIDIGPLMQGILEYGSGGGYEQVLFDYPMRGTTLAITASSIRVKLLQRTPILLAGVLANYSGWLAAADISRDSVIQPPTLTSPLMTVNAIGAAGSVYIDVPARAVGYRPFFPPNVTTYYSTGQNFFQCYQQAGGGIPIRVKMDILNWGATTAPVTAPAVSFQSNMQPWYPLHPQCEIIEVNTASTTQQFIIVQFVLDIT